MRSRKSSIRLVELGEERVNVDEVTLICLVDRHEKLPFLIGRDMERLVSFTPEDRDLFAIREPLAFDDDASARNRSGHDLHDCHSTARLRRSRRATSANRTSPAPRAHVSTDSGALPSDSGPGSV